MFLQSKSRIAKDGFLHRHLCLLALSLVPSCVVTCGFLHPHLCLLSTQGDNSPEHMRAS